MVVPDAYRAQLYFRRLKLGLQDVATTLTRLGLENRLDSLLAARLSFLHQV